MTDLTSYPNDADGDALSRLARDGNDMSRPMVIDFFIDTPTEEIAQDCLERIRTRDFAATSSFDEEDQSWTVTIRVEMIPDYDEIVDFQSVLNKDLGPLGATVDGWGSFGNMPTREEGVS